jgi:ribonuclease Z
MPRLAGVLVEGLSIGGLETCIDCPELKLAFDIGRCPDEVVNRPTILFTHAHMDHMGGVAWHAATRDLRGMGAPTYVIPRENEEGFRELFAAWRKLDRAEAPHHVVALSPGEAWSCRTG